MGRARGVACGTVYLLGGMGCVALSAADAVTAGYRNPQPCL
jgi:hypothetical protein